ncbi:small acid-soluble spore protein K [Halalkalibacter nanhaiisediminis]|uniref:Small acid-soluble spore protein K (Minor) n=1 Tax=Halalkalibacter nanhaiisediminis TaxID=688079 RepID=A0A562Q7Z6_9BACI|nr:small acid-soluble spore protein K [Halalkalibacter nanhaiisediminis]TWI52885.1 small acid-soluble spore protein K (minor) [Halalkalibacter nanhaiisediminis]
MRNKAKDFPNHISFKGKSPNHNEHESKRADGTINTRPRERMRQGDE